MKLYEIPKNSPLRVTVSDYGGDNGSVDLATFHHLDGMYSYCETSDGQPFHLMADTEMELVDGRYEIKENGV